MADLPPRSKSFSGPSSHGARPSRPPRAPVTPRATYRLQLGPELDFARVAELASYLSALGISHVYLSPVLQASPGSTHGYDVVDHDTVSVELGGAEAHATLCARLGEAKLGQLVDIVPNHMAVVPQNPWWWDVLENGRSSRYAEQFDVEWEATEERLRSKVMMPVLGDHSGRLIEAGEIRIVRDGGTFTCRYHEHELPVAPRSLETLLGAAAARIVSDELAFIASSYALLPPPTTTDPDARGRRHRDKEVLRRHLARLAAEDPEVARAIDGELALLNSNPDALDEFLTRQNWRLAYWRTAARDLGYRRFFDINSLVGLRTEDEAVFLETHSLLLRWLAEGVIDGVRVDHVDGLRDPAGYLQRLRSAAPSAWIVVEKILEPGEALRSSWPVDGTTGYEVLHLLTQTLIMSQNEAAFTRLYSDFIGEEIQLEGLIREKKRLVLTELLGSDLNRLTAVFLDVCERNRRFRDYSRHELHEVLREVIAAFPVYRSYVNPERSLVAPEDEHAVHTAVASAKTERPDLDGELFDFLADLLLLRVRGERESEFVARFQQTSSPVMAKGVEDTVFYNYQRFVALNEVGGHPGRFGMPLAEIHDAFRVRAERYPRAMVASSTHDTKRSDDVRARLAVLSEVPDAWREAVWRWTRLLERYKSDDLPDRNLEYLFYQTLLGAWPLETERAQAYLLKAAREAKAFTTWTRTDDRYESALTSFVERSLSDAEFTSDFAAFVAPLIAPGRVNSLSQTLVKLTAPGVADIYQGSELWDLSLVDPDNRRPVDFELRSRLLGELERLGPEAILSRMDEGLPKLWLIRQALALRSERPQPFSAGYEALVAEGSKSAHVFAFIRGGEVVSVAPRLPLSLGGDWGDTKLALPPGRYVDRLSGREHAGGELRLASLLERFPVALLVQEAAS